MAISTLRPATLEEIQATIGIPFCSHMVYSTCKNCKNSDSWILSVLNDYIKLPKSLYVLRNFLCEEQEGRLMYLYDEEVVISTSGRNRDFCIGSWLESKQHV